MNALFQDLKFGLRMLAKNPGFTVVAVLTLALGIGANTAIFSLIDAVLLKMLPVRNPEQLLRVTSTSPDGKTNDFFSYPTFTQFADRSRVFSGVLAFRNLNEIDFAVDGKPELASGQAVSGNYFSVLGVRAAIGRTITPGDDKVSAGSSVVVISFNYWKTRFNCDPLVIGEGIGLNGSPFTIIGVTSPEFYGLEPGESVDLSIPLTTVAQVWPQMALVGTRYDFYHAPFRNWLRLMARVKDGETEGAALANLGPIYDQAMHQAAEGVAGLPFDSPQVRKGFLEGRIKLEPGSRGLTDLRRQFSRPLLVLMVVVGLLLVIACVNVANLLLARARTRQREVALRMALGAARKRLIRQLLTESALLGLAGGAFGMILAFWGSSAILAVMSHSTTPLSLSAQPDAHVLAFTTSISLLAAAVFGLTPALRASRLELSQSLKEGTQSPDSARHRLRLGGYLVLSQIALSLVLLVGASLLVRSLVKLKDFYPGFSKQNVLLISMNPGMIGYKDSQVGGLYQGLLRQMKALPGVTAVSYSMFSPLTPRFNFTMPTVEGYTPRPGENTLVNLNLVGPEYFRTLGTAILLGREFTDADSAGARKVAVINQAMAHYFFGDSNPLGRRFSVPGWVADTSQLEIVGEVENAKSHSLREEILPTAYIPFLQSPDTLPMTFEVRTALRPLALAATVRHLVQKADSRLPIFAVKALSQQVDESLVQERLVASFSALFGLLALSLTCVGLYGLVSYSAAQRTHEIGIRMALGAEPSHVLALVMGQGFKLTLVGIGVGTAVALALTRFLSSLLYGVNPTDPLTFAAVALVMLGVALFASFIPARRATKVDPMEALRYE